MSTASAVIIAVAEELAKQARNSLPKLQPGERIISEGFDGEAYCRTTEYQGEKTLIRYDLRHKMFQRGNADG